MEVLLIRFDAPLMSFGGSAVDNYRITQDYPPLSMLTGLLGNALGYFHREHTKLSRLQQRLDYAVRCDLQGEIIRDFQTVDLNQEALKGTGWTTWSHAEERKGGSSEGTHIRYRDYIADAIYTLALLLNPEDEDPGLEKLRFALLHPARPLFLGRKGCLPAGPLFLDMVEAKNPAHALQVTPSYRSLMEERVGDTRVDAWWNTRPSDHGADDPGLLMVSDIRDWANQVHTGQRYVYRSVIDLGKE